MIIRTFSLLALSASLCFGASVLPVAPIDLPDAPAGSPVAQALALYKGGKAEEAAKAFEKLATEGSMEAQFALAMLYDLGHGVPRSVADAETWYQRAANQGHMAAQYNLGELLLRTANTDDGVKRGAAEIEKAAKAGSQRAMIAMANLYLIGAPGREASLDEVGRWLREAATAGEGGKTDYAILTRLAEIYDTGSNKLKPDPAKAQEIYEEAATAGHAPAMLALASRYITGTGGAKKSADKAREYLQKAADAGDAGGEFGLGSLFESGVGVEKDEAKALKHFTAAAEKGHGQALNKLGFFYEKGMGGAKADEAKALDYYKQAAKAGLPLGAYNASVLAKDEKESTGLLLGAANTGLLVAQHKLGTLYAQGKGGLPQDLVAAAAWFDRSARAGSADSRVALGKMYETGQGVTQDFVSAAKLYAMAADQGHPAAQVFIAQLLEAGRGVKQDPVNAYRYYKLAADQGSEPAKNAVDRLGKTLSAAQLDEAQKPPKPPAESGEGAAQPNP